MAVPVEGTKDKFVVGCGRDLVLVTWDSEKDATDPKIQKLTTLDTNRNGTRINDGKCDPAGRLFVGKYTPIEKPCHLAMETVVMNNCHFLWSIFFCTDFCKNMIDERRACSTRCDVKEFNEKIKC